LARNSIARSRHRDYDLYLAYEHYKIDLYRQAAGQTPAADAGR
jgi:hypothetical protein